MPKKSNTKKPSVKVNDLRSKKNPKGGGANLKEFTFSHKYDKASPTLSTASKLDSKIVSSIDALKIK